MLSGAYCFDIEFLETMGNCLNAFFNAFNELLISLELSRVHYIVFAIFYIFFQVPKLLQDTLVVVLDLKIVHLTALLTLAFFKVF